MPTKCQRSITIAPDFLPDEPLRDFPLLVSVQDDEIRAVRYGGKVAQESGADIRFMSWDGKVPFDHEIEAFDPQDGTLRAWVCVPELSRSVHTKLLIAFGDSEAMSTTDPAAAWRNRYPFVVHGMDPTKAYGEGAHFTNAEQHTSRTGRAWMRVPCRFNSTEGLTVEAWVDVRNPRVESIQPLLSSWPLASAFDAFDAYDAGQTDGLDTTGYFGAVFDGRYIYFAPQHDLQTRHGKVLRFDTHGDFRNVASWSAFDAGDLGGLATKGYYGAVHAGRYIFFCPRRDPEGFHSRVLRYDRQGSFKDPASWDVYEVGIPNSCQSAAFDGRYIYFCPGQESRPKTAEELDSEDDSPKVTGMRSDQLLISSGTILRHDTQGGFKDPASWITFDATDTDGLDTRDFDGAVYDGRYVYFMPLSYGAVLRYDTHADFECREGWSAYESAKLGVTRLVGGVYDGRYVYLVPYGDCGVAVRYDTQKDFTDDESWQAYTLAETARLKTTGYDGGCFDGRYVYYIPYWNEGKDFHGVALRYDTCGDFLDPSSWCSHDAGIVSGLRTVGFNGGASDGRYLYFAPWTDGRAFPDRIIGNGRVLRYDTTTPEAVFSLRYSDYGSNGGLCAALPGTRFLLNTDAGVFSVAADRRPEAGFHHVAATYDGQTLRLFIDGTQVNTQTAGGRVNISRLDVMIGRLCEGGVLFDGDIHEARISSVARSPEWIRAQAENLRNPDLFCRLDSQEET